MNGIASELDKFRRQVNQNLLWGSLSDLELPVTNNEGRFQVLVALEDELLATVLGRLRAVGGFANLFVRANDGTVRMAAFIEELSAIPIPDDDMSSSMDRPGPTASIGMFLDWVQTHPNGVSISAGVGHPARARHPQPVELTSV